MPIQNSQSSQSLWQNLADLLGNFDRPRGALVSTLQGTGPVEGFKDPSQYHFYDEDDSTTKKIALGAFEALIDPLNLVGAAFLSPLKGASLGARLLAEAGMNASARTASDTAAFALDDPNTPEWLRIGGPIAAGLVGGIGSGAAISRNAARGRNAIPTAAPSPVAPVRSADEAKAAFDAEVLHGDVPQTWGRPTPPTPRMGPSAMIQQEEWAGNAAYADMVDAPRVQGAARPPKTGTVIDDMEEAIFQTSPRVLDPLDTTRISVPVGSDLGLPNVSVLRPAYPTSTDIDLRGASTPVDLPTPASVRGRNRGKYVPPPGEEPVIHTNVPLASEVGPMGGRFIYNQTGELVAFETTQDFPVTRPGQVVQPRATMRRVRTLVGEWLEDGGNDLMPYDQYSALRERNPAAILAMRSQRQIATGGEEFRRQLGGVGGGLGGRALDPDEMVWAQRLRTLGYTEPKSRSGVAAFDGRSWTAPDGQEFDISDTVRKYGGGPQTLSHEHVAAQAQDVDFYGSVSFAAHNKMLKQGWIRKAAPGVYTVYDIDAPGVRDNLERLINKDLDAIREGSPALAQRNKMPADVAIDTLDETIHVSVPPTGRFSFGNAPASTTAQFHAQKDSLSPDMRARMSGIPGGYGGQAVNPNMPPASPEALAAFVGADERAVELRAAVLRAAQTGQPPVTINAQAAIEDATGIGEFYRKLSGDTAENTLARAEAIRVSALPDSVKADLAPSWGTRIANTVSNNPTVARRSASVGYNYIGAQKHAISVVHNDVNTFVKNELGPKGEMVSLSPSAPDHVKASFLGWQKYGYENGWVGTIKEFPEHFNLTPSQRQYFADLKSLERADVDLDDLVGADTSALHNADGALRVENYSRHMVEMLDPAGKPLSTEMRTMHLGADRSYQKNRMFDSWADIWAAASEENNASFHAQIQKAIASEMRDGNADEVTRLQNLLQSGIRIGVRRASFADSIVERLSQSAKRRGETIAMNTLRKSGGDITAEGELNSLLSAGRISDALKIPAEAAGLLRSFQLRLDASYALIQGWGAIAMGRGLKGGMHSYAEAFNTFRSDEGWAKYSLLHADEMARERLSGLELSDSIPELAEDLDILKRKFMPKSKWLRGIEQGPGTITTPGKKIALDYFQNGMNAIDDIQFGRMAVAYKRDMFHHTFDLMKAARDGNMGILEMLGHPSLALSQTFGSFKNFDDEALRQASASFSNNLFGGLNRVAKGRTVSQNLLESVIALTPGFTRGTISLGLQAGNLAKWTPEYALARDFAVRGTLLAGVGVSIFGAAVNGITGGTLPAVNVTDPTKDDWMAIPLPDGKWIRPLSRFRSPGQIVGATVSKMLDGNMMEAATYFGPAALRWATYRQSALVTAGVGDIVGDIGRAQFDPESNYGNTFARGRGVTNLLTDPMADRREQVAGILTGSLPLAVGSMVESYRGGGSASDLAIAVGAELLGQGSTIPSRTEVSVRSAAADLVAAMGVPQEAIAQALVAGDMPTKILDPQTGLPYLTSAQRREVVEKVAASLGVEEEVVAVGGRRNLKQKKQALDAIDKAQTDNFFKGLDVADTHYNQKMTMMEKAVENGLPLSEVSSYISDARKARAEAKKVVTEMNPLAIELLRSPERMKNQHSKDVLFSAIATDAFAVDFFDKETLTFDFDAREEHYAKLRQTYGASFDEWLSRSDEKKRPIERQRDDAFDRLGTYFSVESELWDRVTGGQLGESEKDFDRQMLEGFVGQGISDPSMQQFMLSQIKSQIMPIAAVHSLTAKVRDILRASDPQMEADVTTWLGAQPIAFKKVSKADRSLLDDLIAKGR